MITKEVLEEIDRLTTHQLITEVERGWIQEFIDNTTIGDIESIKKGIYTEEYSINMFKILSEFGDKFFESTLVSPNKAHAIKRNFKHIHKIYCGCVNEINSHFGRHVIHKESFVDYMCSQLPIHKDIFREALKDD